MQLKNTRLGDDLAAMRTWALAVMDEEMVYEAGANYRYVTLEDWYALGGVVDVVCVYVGGGCAFE